MIEQVKTEKWHAESSSLSERVEAADVCTDSRVSQLALSELTLKYCLQGPLQHDTANSCKKL